MCVIEIPDYTLCMVECYQQEALHRVEVQAESVIRRMAIELESGGNVRFEEGNTSDVW